MSPWERRGWSGNRYGRGAWSAPCSFYPTRPRGRRWCPSGGRGAASARGAESFARAGFAALALAYFGLDGLPRELVEIPLEYFERAIAWLKRHPMVDAGQVAVVGNSKGGELALLLGATFPRDVGAVVGYAPSALVWQGIAFDREVYYGGPRSPWAIRGEAVPFVPLARPGAAEMIRMTEALIEDRPIGTRAFYERALRNESAVAAASVPVEEIEAPVLLISGTDDRLWPSTRLSEMAIRRLEAHDRPFPREHLRYEGAGHMIAPPGYEPAASWTNRFELGGSREADEFANADSWPRVIAFLEDAFDHHP
jgi:uncharacterized protein